MEDQYQKLNEYLNIYCESYNYSLYMGKISYYLRLSMMVHGCFMKLLRILK